MIWFVALDEKIKVAANLGIFVIQMDSLFNVSDTSCWLDHCNCLYGTVGNMPWTSDFAGTICFWNSNAKVFLCRFCHGWSKMFGNSQVQKNKKINKNRKQKRIFVQQHHGARWECSWWRHRRSFVQRNSKLTKHGLRRGIFYGHL